MAQRLITTPSDARVARGLRAQLGALDRRIAAGERPLGWKIALNSPRVQERLALSGPLIGYLTDASRHPPGVPLALDPARIYLVEAELAARISRDVPAGTPESDCGAAVGSLAPAIELLDMTGGVEDLEGALAANGFHSAFLLGEERGADPPVAAADLDLELRVGDREPLGLDPELLVGELPAVVRFIADLLGAFGRRLRAGEWISCGSLNPVARVRPGDRVDVELRPLGHAALELV